MTTPHTSSPASTHTQAAERLPLRIELHLDGSNYVHGAWWPRSRDLASEGAQLVDEFPVTAGRIRRLLFSRPDWDDGVVEGHGLRRIRAQRGTVKVGSFPSDDTHLMVLGMDSGSRLRLLVIPPGTEQAEGERRLREVGDHGLLEGTDADWARWDDEAPTH